MADSTNERKIEHLHVIEKDHGVDRKKFYFDDIALTHRALPEMDLNDVDPSVEFLGKRLSFPLIISCMTGGDHNVIRTINENLARAAEATGVAMGVGSQRVMFSNPESRSSFEIRSFAPTALLFSNLGAVQLNKGFDVSQCEEAVAAVQADGLYLHLNPLQEAVQPEGDVNFSGLAGKIGAVADSLSVPVIMKEVGSGISPADVKLLMDRGIKHIDIAGAGGTSWSRIEHRRQPDGNGDALGLVFQDWGIPTPTALKMLSPYRDRVSLIASGGVRTGVDMVKAIALGATCCGLASPFLGPAKESHEAVIRVIERVRKEFITAMFLLGKSTVDQVFGNETLILESPQNQGGRHE